MNCKYCNSENVTKKGIRHNKQTYKCKDCGHIFLPNGKFSRMRNDKKMIVTALNLYYDGLSHKNSEEFGTTFWCKSFTSYNSKLD